MTIFARVAEQRLSWSRNVRTSVIARLLKDESGLSALMLGIGLIPILLGVGMAFDTTRAHLLRTELSTAVDAAALAGGRAFFDDNRDQDVRNYFDANFSAGILDANLDDFSVVENVQAGSLNVSATATMPTVFMKLVGVDTITVSASGTATRRSVPLDVVLAIDVSGSMLEDVPGEGTSRIDAAKAAAEKLVDILYGNPPSPLVRVGIVPWAGKVNITDAGTTFGKFPDNSNRVFPANPATDSGNEDTAWHAESLTGFFPNPYDDVKYTFYYHQDQSTGRPTTYPISTDTKPYTSGSAKNKVWQRLILNEKADFTPGYYQDPVSRLFFAHNSPVPLMSPPNPGWTGCVYARYAFNGDPAKYTSSGSYDNADDLNNSAALDNAADIFDGPVEDVGPGNLDWIGWMPMGYEGDERSGGLCDASHLASRTHECTPCPVTGITRLTNSKPAIDAAIANVNAVSGSYTNIPEGMGWAWRVLSPEAPYTESSAELGGIPAARRARAIILLSDGDNTVRAGDAYNYSLTTQSRREDRLKILADKIKTPGPDGEEVLIYTIQFADNSAEQTTLMKYVASEPDEPFYFYAPSSEELENVFQTVATNLAELRLSQ